MKKIKDNIKIGIVLLICLILAQFIITILYTNQYFVKFGLDADFATDSIYAKFLAKTGGILLSDDWYPSTELYIVHHQLIMTPLFHIFDDYETVYTMTTAVAFIAIALAIYYFMKTFTESTFKSLLTVVLVCNPINFFFVLLAITFHGYLFYAIFGILYITILFKLIYKKINRFETISFMIISFLSGICGIRMFFILFVPLILLLLWKYQNYRVNFRKECFKEMFSRSFLMKHQKEIKIIMSYVLALLGFLIFYCFLMPQYGGADKLETMGTNNANIASNIKDISLLLLNGINFDVGGKKLISISFIKATVLLLFWIYIFAQNIKFAFRKGTKQVLQDISLYNLICLLVTILFMIITLSNQDIQQALRYFGLAIYLMIPAAIMGLEKDNTLKSIGVYLIIFLAIFVGLDSHVDAIKIAKDLKNSREGYVKFLDESDYSFGTATYWNANITTFLSEKEIEIRPALSEIDLGMYQWNTRKSYANKEPEFLILTKEEYEVRKKKEEKDKIVYQDDFYMIIDLKQV